MVQIRPPKNRTTAAKESCTKHYVNLLPEEAQGQQMGVCSRQRNGGRPVAGRAEKTQKEDGTWDRRQTRRCGASCARSARPTRSCWGSAGAIMAALCVRRGDGGTLRLPKQDVHDALTRYEFAAAAEGEDYVLSYRERGT